MRVQKDPTVSVHAWFSARDLTDTDLIDRLGHSQFTGAILSPDEAVEYDQRLSPSLLRVVQLHADETDEFLDEWDDANRLVILSDCAEVLEVARQRGSPRVIGDGPGAETPRAPPRRLSALSAGEEATSSRPRSCLVSMSSNSTSSQAMRKLKMSPL